MFRSSQPPEPAGFGVGCKATVLLLLAGGALAGCGGSHPATTSTTTQISKLDVKLEASPRLRTATPQFALRNSLGHRVRLSQFRGRAVILTFIYDHCPDTCPLIVENLVELSFRDLGESTEVVLTQHPFKTEARRELHAGGWADSFDKLEQFVAQA